MQDKEAELKFKQDVQNVFIWFGYVINALMIVVCLLDPMTWILAVPPFFGLFYRKFGAVLGYIALFLIVVYIPVIFEW